MVMQDKGTLFIISAPSGAGKTTLVNAVLDSLKPLYPIDRVVTYTSRSPRSGETNGVDYHFIPEGTFATLVEEDFFLEWSTAYGTYYGTPKAIKDDLDNGRNLILIPDRIGTSKIMSKFDLYIYKVITIWVEAPSLEILEERLKSRGQNTPEQLAQRLSLATQEMRDEVKSPLYTYKIINNIFNISLEKLRNLIENEIFFKEKKQNKNALGTAEKPH
jgi:guanylate kinase